MLEVKRRFSQFLLPGRADKLETKAALILLIHTMWGSNANDKPINLMTIPINIEKSVNVRCVSDWV